MSPTPVLSTTPVPPPVAPAAAPAVAGAPHPAAPVTSAPSGPAAPAPAAPTGTAPAQGAAGASAVAPAVTALVKATSAIDATWVASARQAQAAVAALGPNAKPDAATTSSITRLGFIGTVLGETIPKGTAAPALAKGVDPKTAVLDAEKALHSAIAGAVKSSNAVADAMPKDAPKEVVEAFMATQERITDALYAVKFSLRFAPPPAPPAPPAGTAAPAAPAGAPAPAAPAPAATGGTTPAAPATS